MMSLEIAEIIAGSLLCTVVTVCDGVPTVVVGVVYVCIQVDRAQFNSGILFGSKSTLDFRP